MQRRIFDAVAALAIDPRPHGAEKMQGEWRDYWKIRITIHYRVMYVIDDERRSITIAYVTTREGVPY